MEVSGFLTYFIEVGLADVVCFLAPLPYDPEETFMISIFGTLLDPPLAAFLSTFLFT
jgi:hypothetical protein